MGVPSSSGYPVILSIWHHGARGRAGNCQLLLSQTGGDTGFILFISPFIFLFSPYPLFHCFLGKYCSNLTQNKSGARDWELPRRGEREAGCSASALVWPGARLPLAVGQG